MKNLLKFVIFILFVAIGTAGLLSFFGLKPTGYIPDNGTDIQVRSGESVRSLSMRLENDRYIGSAILFEVIVRATNLDKQLRTGWFHIDKDSSTLDIIKTIFSGRLLTVRFTIPEGSTVRQIRDILVNNGIVEPEEIDRLLNNPNYTSIIGLDGFRSAEGFLFPDTYTVNKGTLAADILAVLVRQFYNEVSKIYPQYRSLSHNEFFKKIIIASIIEKEVRSYEEAPIVAGVFYNRIENGMLLQSCATVQYILDKPKERLLFEDLEIDNPYNTYLYRGLPPGPVSNPGREALNAAFYPTSHNYLFFVVKDPVLGTHHFSRTFAEHLAAQERYKAIRGFFD